MTLLDDPQADRISDEVSKCSDRATMTRWVRALLEDRKARSALILRLARELHHVRGRLAQASAYLDGLLGRAHEATREPWPQQLPCEHCGAPAESAAAIPQTPTGHQIVTRHPDGTTCHAKAKAPSSARR
jgi:hypothetical protein